MEGTIYRKRRLYIAAPHTAKHHKTRCGAEKPTAYPKKEEYTIFPDVFDVRMLRHAGPRVN
jgi:hypothetical protein